MKVLVTGATGFLGRHLVAALDDAGYQVRTLARSSLDLPGAEHYRADLRSGLGLRDAAAEVDIVIHLAAVLDGDAGQQMEVATAGTANLLTALPPTTSRMVLISSQSVYDWDRIGLVLHDDSPLLETEKSRLLGGYAAAKLAQEKVTRDLCTERGIALTVVRPATVWGTGRLAFDMVGPSASGRQLVVAPLRTLRLTHVTNCADAIIASLHPDAAGRSCNIDDGHGWTPTDYTHQFAPDQTVVRVPETVVRLAQALGGPAAAAARRGRRVPGLLIPARSRARFHAAAVDPGFLSDQLGWRPPLDRAATVAATLGQQGDTQ